LIAAFPYSRQVRAVYLFNDKLRGMLSLWFVPLLLSIVPGARRHLLRPFRTDLLRDARINDFDESNWFRSSEVLDRGGVRLRLADAVPLVAGVCLLVGNRGSGRRSSSGAWRNNRVVPSPFSMQGRASTACPKLSCRPQEEYRTLGSSSR